MRRDLTLFHNLGHSLKILVDKNWTETKGFSEDSDVKMWKIRVKIPETSLSHGCSFSVHTFSVVIHMYIEHRRFHQNRHLHLEKLLDSQSSGSEEHL